jgi:hypothetical protein
MDNMIDLGGTVYVIDLEKFNSLLLEEGEPEKAIETESRVTYSTELNGLNGEMTPISTVVTSREYDKPKEINTPKYDVLRMCLEILFTYNEQVDDTLGEERALKGTSIPFKVAFNTLLNYGVLKEAE